MEEDWVTITKGKRSRPRKIKEQNPPSKKAKKSKDQDISTNFNEPSPEIEVKHPKRKKKELARSFCPEGIAVKDLQNLILWVYGKGVNPNWFFIKNKHLVSRLVVIAIGGFNQQIYVEQLKYFPKSESIFSSDSIVTVAPGSDYKVYSPLQSLLYLPDKKKTKKKNTPTISTLPPSEYVHSLSELKANGFPLRIKTIDNGEGPSDVSIVEYEKLPNFVVFDEIPVVPSQELIAIDCEMCLTKAGSELTRVTLVDMNSEVIYDQLVKPNNEITDYLTRYSGITKELLDPVTMTLEDVQDHLKSIISKSTILVGHSLENDLMALKISHFRVIDTSIIFPHNAGPPSKLSLKGLVQSHLHRVIQTGSHDSAQDAIAAMELTLLKIKRGPSYGIQQNGGDSIFKKLISDKITCTMLDRASLVQAHCPTGISCETDEEIITKLPEVCNREDDPPKFTYAQLHSLSSYYKSLQNGDGENIPEEKDVYTSLDNAIHQIYESLPKNSFLIITSGQANLSNCQKLWKIKREGEVKWTAALDNQLKKNTEIARKGLSLFAIK